MALGTEGEQSKVRITIHEGRNRQVRRMFAAIGHPVVRLKRLSVGTVSLEGLALGGYRPLTPQEVVALKQQTGHEEGQP
ncbi:Ribosomal large subunit pseudouridine synthase B [compost metagenome]